ncbi:MAG: hypothetical protein B6241_08625 [Spirochaetaceae bacterium 4572_59]|nr:MAG: hypothetical protein B6241_08625 [Spirochaetaceae bacterium 4572_59]
MIISKLALRNFRGIHDLDVNLNKQLNVICGINGVGKSSILDAIAIQLSWIVARIRTGKSPGRPISEHDVKNDEPYSKTELFIKDDGYSYSGKLVKYKKGRLGDEKSSMIDFSNCAKRIRQEITDNENTSIPVFIYYSTNRVVNDIPLRIRGKHEFNLLETYDGSLESGVNFRSFFEWYRNREDLENENFREMTKEIKSSQYNPSSFNDKQLETVRKAISSISGFSGISVNRNPLRMEVSKNGEKLRVDQLSDGEKCLLAMAGDLARRLSIANPSLSNPLEGEGIVLIDEIDLHLHPQWQKKIILKLMQTFSNIQFIVSTHSPQVLSEVEGNNIYSLYLDKQKNISCYKPDQAIGLTSSEILEILMETNSINELVKREIDEIFNLIDTDKFIIAKDYIAAFIKKYGSVPDISRAEALITMYSDVE